MINIDYIYVVYMCASHTSFVYVQSVGKHLTGRFYVFACKSSLCFIHCILGAIGCSYLLVYYRQSVLQQIATLIVFTRKVSFREVRTLKGPWVLYVTFTILS